MQIAVSHLLSVSNNERSAFDANFLHESTQIRVNFNIQELNPDLMEQHVSKTNSYQYVSKGSPNKFK
jgi:hypothetical protein